MPKPRSRPYCRKCIETIDSSDEYVLTPDGYYCGDCLDYISPALVDKCARERMAVTDHRNQRTPTPLA